MRMRTFMFHFFWSFFLIPLIPFSTFPTSFFQVLPIDELTRLFPIAVGVAPPPAT